MDLVEFRLGFFPSLGRLPVGRARLGIDEAELLVQVLDHDEGLLEDFDPFQDESMGCSADDQSRALGSLDFPSKVLGLIVPRGLSEDFQSRGRDSPALLRDVVIGRVLLDQKATLGDLRRCHGSGSF